MADAEVLLSLRKIVKGFGSQKVLSEFSLDIFDGEFFTILGPSGCGKTTVLRLIAGFEQADSGQILLDDADIAAVAAEHRPVNTVFQSYALFPHMSVAENVGFGLRMAAVTKAEIKQRVAEALAVVKLSGFESRKPHQLSGGQKQRVAIARAIVMKPKVLLLDESLSALDHKLRQQMQMELKQIQRKLGITFVYVTHDQEEALSMSDRVLVMNHGQPQQIGSPREIYEAPRNMFVADFIGEINVFDGVVEAENDELSYTVNIGGVKKVAGAEFRLEVGDEVHVLLRPEDLRIEYIEDQPKDEQGFLGKVLERSYTGKTIDTLIALENGNTLRASEFFNEDDPDFDYSINQRVWVSWIDGWEHVIKAGPLE
ncbi:spermidine/putrescine import ATP-binding protein PotA [Neiella marina]|uniref:Spermidine/putrescine import ATP-binding protein PotA n=1 Tax=Neiella marina TaxID=508461 RepID=A0A8J2U5R2_9GAMM|nr:spermidine/putrescine ABC transporter ATP-binding protein PotA [Neiella marina]GGA79851.1 spermidine/putrescine import ATP-binding protein PotA [Neiella marina]